MGRLSRHLRVAVVLPVLALAGCGVGTPQPDRAPVTGSAPSASASSARAMAAAPSTPVPPVPSPDPAEAAAPISRAEQAALDEQLRAKTWENDLDRVVALIERGADVNAKDNTEQSAYLITTSEGYLDLLDLTLAHGALIDDKDSWNGTGLIRAAERGHALVVGRLLEAGIDRDHVNRIGYQAIHEAIWLGQDTRSYHDTIRALVAGGVELSRSSSNEGLTPLQMAQQRGYPGIEAILRTALDPPEMPNPDAALLRAARTGDPDLAALAVRAGADLEARDTNKRTALLLAAANDRVDVARLLVALGADPDALDDRHDSPWLVTGVTGSVPMLEALLPADPDLTIRNRFGGTSLIPASERGHVDYVQRVLQTEIDVNHVNSLGWTALLEAVILGDGGPDHQQIVRLLLDAGADPTVGDNDGVTALQHAQARGHTTIAGLLSER
jgi:ankyrin repeat protein